MKKIQSPVFVDAAKMFTTATLSSALTMRPQSIRKRLCETGEYYGLRPTKLPNGRLLWPADAIEQLTSARTK